MPMAHIPINTSFEKCDIPPLKHTSTRHDDTAQQQQVYNADIFYLSQMRAHLKRVKFR